MKNMKTVLGVASAAAVGAAVICGCSTPTIPVTMNVAGEIKLTGVSKIALVDFNSMPDDPFTGKVAADAETCALVQRTVASAFYKTPTYQVANLTDEEAIAAAQGSLPDKRFDAIVCGRLWWQITPETDGEYVRQFTLDSWENVPYKQKVMGKEVPMIAKVVTQKKDVLRLLKYRTRSAALMLSLAFYRVDGNGGISKIVDTYQVTEQGFTLMNGEMKTDVAVVGMKNDGAVARLQKTGKDDDAKTAYEEMFGEPKGLLAGAVGGAAANAAGQAAGGALGGLSAGFGGLGSAIGGAAADAVKEVKPKEAKPAKKAKVDANGKVILSQETVTMPTELQAKLMLAAKLSDEIAAKVAPTEVTFESPWMDKVILWFFEKRFDAKLTELLKNRAWDATRQYAAFKIRQAVGKELSEQIASIKDVPATYPVAKSEESFKEDEAEDMTEYFVDEDVPTYLYALAIAQEASGDAFAALDTYTEAFNMKPTKETALGISRCNMSIGQAKRVNETNKAKNKASKKAKLN